MKRHGYHPKTIQQGTKSTQQKGNNHQLKYVS